MEEFTPSRYDEDEDEETFYAPGMPYVMRDQGLHNPDELLLVVLGDMADIAREGNLPDAADLQASYDKCEPIIRSYEDESDTYGDTVDYLDYITFYPPEGLTVDWDGDAGTVVTTLTAGWPSPTDQVDCDRCRTNHPADQHCEPVK